MRITFVSLAVLGLALAACGTDRGHRYASNESSGASSRAAANEGMYSERSTTGGSGSSIRPSRDATAAAVGKDEIRRAQEALKAQGLYNDKVDGIMGPNTKEALRQFQAREGLQETASLDRATRQRLTSQPTGSGGSTPGGETGAAPSGASGTTTH
jgi:peptidoglycan hydrolase-like protein with peptidoglycan-binding domain